MVPFTALTGLRAVKSSACSLKLFLNCRLLRGLVTATSSTKDVLSHDVYSNSSSQDKSSAIFLHGILGSKRNWRSVCNEMGRRVPTMQSVSIDHRGHGASASM